MKIIKEHFDVTKSGHEIINFMMENRNGFRVGILNYGGIIHSVWMTSYDRLVQNVVVSFETIEEYEKHMHIGGLEPFHRQIWNVSEMVSEDKIVLTLHYEKIQVRYSLTNSNELTIDYEGTDDLQALRLCNRCYLNLSGLWRSNSITDHALFIDGIPTPDGQDYQMMRLIDNGKEEQVYALNISEREHATVSHSRTGRNVDIRTNQEKLHLLTCPPLSNTLLHEMRPECIAGLSLSASITMKNQDENTENKRTRRITYAFW